jgi:hypothetical protein
MDHGNQQLGSLLGLIFIAPTVFTSVVPFLPIPLVVFTSRAPDNDIHRRHALVNPSVIVIVNDEIGEPNMANFSESTALWVARTVAKGANAICVLSSGRHPSQTIKSRL